LSTGIKLTGPVRGNPLRRPIVVNNITQRTDLSSQPWQIYTKASFGATRTQPGKVFQIQCADTTGVDINP